MSTVQFRPPAPAQGPTRISADLSHSAKCPKCPQKSQLCPKLCPRESQRNQLKPIPAKIEAEACGFRKAKKRIAIRPVRMAPFKPARTAASPTTQHRPKGRPISHPVSCFATTQPSDPSQFLDEKLLESAARLFDTVDGED
jgi:hypothetical protein